jgi:hypothetical protein
MNVYSLCHPGYRHRPTGERGVDLERSIGEWEDDVITMYRSAAGLRQGGGTVERKVSERVGDVRRSVILGIQLVDTSVPRPPLRRQPSEYGLPEYRTKVLYIPQRPSLLPGSPRDFIRTITSFSSRRTKGSNPSSSSADPPSSAFDRAVKLARAWGIEPYLWDREWSNLSGGEAQRLGLAVGLGLGGAEVVLLDGQSGGVLCLLRP